MTGSMQNNEIPDKEKMRNQSICSNCRVAELKYCLENI